MSWPALFTEKHPQAVDCLELEYKGDKDAADAAAMSAGYRLTGYRLGRAVFTTKPEPQPAQAIVSADSIQTKGCPLDN